MHEPSARFSLCCALPFPATKCHGNPMSARKHTDGFPDGLADNTTQLVSHRECLAPIPQAILCSRHGFLGDCLTNYQIPRTLFIASEC